LKRGKKPGELRKDAQKIFGFDRDALIGKIKIGLFVLRVIKSSQAIKSQQMIKY